MVVSRPTRGFAAYFHWVAENRDAFVLLYDGASRQDQEFSAAVRKVTAEAALAIAPLIDAGIDPEHQLTLAHAIVGLSEGASRRLVERGGVFDPDEVAGQLSAFAVGRTARRPPARPDALTRPDLGGICAKPTSRVDPCRIMARFPPGSTWTRSVRRTIRPR